MFIQTEVTPNPNSLKFLPGCEVGGKKVKHFETKTDTKSSKLAQKLFNVSDVNAVFFGSDFITITKKESTEWDIVKPEILTIIMDHFVAGWPAFDFVEDDSKSSSDDNEIITERKELIDNRIRPAVAQDGGDIVFHSYEDGIVKLILHGACSGCPSATVTLKNGIENMLKYYIPEIISVEAVKDEE